MSFEVIEVLGQGSFGKVYRMKNKANNIEIAVKHIKEVRGNGSLEHRIIANCSHERIVSSYGCQRYGAELFIAQDVCSGGTLASALRSKRYDDSVKLFWCEQMAIAIEHLHSKNIVHMDLKPDNIFLDRGSNIKIGDFGLAVVFSPQNSPTLQVQQPVYCSPEFASCVLYTKKSDIWSLGCIFFELFTNKPAFTNWTDLISTQLSMSELTRISQPLPTDLVTGMLDMVSFKRPTAQDVRNRIKQVIERQERKDVEMDPKMVINTQQTKMDTEETPVTISWSAVINNIYSYEQNQTR